MRCWRGGKQSTVSHQMSSLTLCIQIRLLSCKSHYLHPSTEFNYCLETSQVCHQISFLRFFHQWGTPCSSVLPWGSWLVRLWLHHNQICTHTHISPTNFLIQYLIGSSWRVIFNVSYQHSFHIQTVAQKSTFNWKKPPSLCSYIYF